MCVLFFAFGYDTAAFVGVLAVLQAYRVFIGAFPFGTATRTGGFVFVGPDFEFGSTDMAVDVGGFGLEQVAESGAGLGIFLGGGIVWVRVQLCHPRF
jgi:hypothetical protein